MSRKYGFTIVELLVVIAILSVCSAALYSSSLISFFQRWKALNSFNRDVHSVLSLITKARVAAVEFQRPVYLCGGELCNGDWNHSIILRLSDSSKPLASLILSADSSMEWRGFPVSRQYIEFLSNGLSSYQNGSFYLCYEGLIARRILMNQSGRAYLDPQEYSFEVCQ